MKGSNHWNKGRYLSAQLLKLSVHSLHVGSVQRGLGVSVATQRYTESRDRALPDRVDFGGVGGGRNGQKPFEKGLLFVVEPGSQLEKGGCSLVHPGDILQILRAKSVSVERALREQSLTRLASMPGLEGSVLPT